MPDSLFTFNSEAGSKIVAKLDSLLTPLGLGTSYFLYYLVIIGLFIILYPLAREMVKIDRFRNLLILILLIFFTRLLLLDNPFAWKIYHKILTQQDIGYREFDIIGTQIDRFKRSLMPKPTKFLAVGSSQVGGIFYNWGGPPIDLKIYSVAGMKPIDYLLYRDDLQKYRPQNILLYLSEFDIAVIPQIETVLLGPRQGLNLVGIWKKIIECGLWNEYKNMLVHIAIAEILPEYKYAFIFRGMVKKVWEPKPANANTNSPGPTKDKSKINAEIMKSIEQLNSAFQDVAIQFNIECLKEFIAFCKDQNIKVIIVEGQYNPLAYTPKALTYNTKVKEMLFAISQEYPNVHFIPRTLCYQFRSLEYTDISHVVPEAARRFTKQLSLPLLQGNANAGNYVANENILPHFHPTVYLNFARIETRYKENLNILTGCPRREKTTFRF